MDAHCNSQQSWQLCALTSDLTEWIMIVNEILMVNHTQLINQLSFHFSTNIGLSKNLPQR